MREDPKDIRIAELEEEVRQLRHLLRLEPDRFTFAAIRDGLDLSPTNAAIIAALYRAGAAWMPRATLDTAVPPKDHVIGRNLGTISALVSRLRRRFGDEFILCKRHSGYTLGAPGVRACRRAVEQARAAATADNLPLFEPALIHPPENHGKVAA